MIIKNPIIELLAIKLYEHDAQNGIFLGRNHESMTNWFKLADEDRELYREIARGDRELPNNMGSENN